MPKLHVCLPDNGAQDPFVHQFLELVNIYSLSNNLTPDQSTKDTPITYSKNGDIYTDMSACKNKSGWVTFYSSLVCLISYHSC